ncbi:hypothetical protein quinque_003677 [Culex quinquefasciatus]
MLLVIFFVVSLLTLAYRAFRYRLTYWKRHGIPQLQPAIPFGDFGPVFRQNRFYGELLKDLYLQSKHLPLVGIYVTSHPVLVAVEPELIKAILVRDAECFGDRGLNVDDDRDPMAANIFHIQSDRAKDLRSRLYSTFSAAKMRGYFMQLSSTAFSLVGALERSAGSVVEVQDVMSRYTADGTAAVLFGLEADSINDEHDMFREVARRAVAVDAFNLMRIAFYFLAPKFKNWLGINSDLALKDEMVAAHALFFIIGSYEASTTTTSFCLYELAKNVDIQQKAQQEIDSVISKEEGELTVENMTDMRYVDWCINETYRKYPTVPILFRRCTKDYLVSEHNITIPSGSTVVIPLLGLANDPEFFPNPEAFLPERFENRPDYGLPFYAFGAGPRSCIAKRLGHLQTKVALVMLLAKFDIALANPDEGSVQFHPKFFITKPVGGLNIVFTKRD